MQGLSCGAHWGPEGTTFVVCTTTTADVAVRVLGDRLERLRPTDRPSFYEARIEGLPAGALYEVLLDGEAVPDPFARSLPRGVHGPAEVVPPGAGAPIAAPASWSIYELHVGTFTGEGTFRAAIEELDHVADLGVTAIELMPVAAFAGHHGWGYDGVALYAPHVDYGTPSDLRALVDAAHARGLAVILDVVYNHFGPAGNYLARYAPQYFTAHVKTPWGDGPDFTWPPMRRLVLDNVRYWLDEYGIDGLRLDATHAIHDASETHIVAEICAVAHERGRVVFCEDDPKAPTAVRDHGADGAWADDLHHQIHVLLTGERDGYYAAFEPTVDALARCVRAVDRASLVTCVQNHDQIGNRADGTRLTAAVDLDAFCAAATLLLFLPSTPLLFMGQEWAASTPFLYFSDHEGDLGRAVSEGRRKEHAALPGFAGDVPDPQARATFESSRLRWEERGALDHARALAVHRAMLRLRREDPVFARPGPVEARAEGDVLHVVRVSERGARHLVVNFGARAAPVPLADGAHVLFSSGAPIVRSADGCMIPARTAVVLTTGQR
ncbi:MAG: DUF3459 domain-containing protein [Labilithrix sp.]|nr:DUF3459 domain-containing protein [Labilithrix sp.]MCW5816027.1 DUF3459 domain-containing protein [Labilithrix sp.]